MLFELIFKAVNLVESTSSLPGGRTRNYGNRRKKQQVFATNMTMSPAADSKSCGHLENIVKVTKIKCVSPLCMLGLGRFTDASMYRDTFKFDTAIVSWTVVSIQNDT